MCGRTACTLAPDDIVKACRFRNGQGKYSRPVWKDPPGGQQYYPCYNIAPTAHTPVLLSSQHYRGELDSFSERVIQPMKWGLVPLWHKGDPYKLQYETNNCRAEGMLTKRTYKVPLEKGKRCVVLADGFFEWKRGAEGKQPYFIYFPQKSSADTKPDIKSEYSPAKTPIKQEPKDTNTVPLRPGSESSGDSRVKLELVDLKSDPNAESSQNARIKQEPTDGEESDQDIPVTQEREQKEESDKTSSSSADGGAKGAAVAADSVSDGEVEEWQGKRLLTMAGVFDMWHPPDGSPPLYSYSVITVQASPSMAGIHDRMPAILSTEEEISAWLDFDHVPLKQAVSVIHPTETISMHMVSPVVNNSRNKSSECVQVYNPKQVKQTGSSSMMMNWLKKGCASGDPSASPASKKPKLQ